MSRFGWTRVDRERLRAAVLEGDAVLPMIGADARAAADLVTRAVIDPEAHARFSMLGEAGLGITDAPHWFAPLPERGPFLALLLNEKEAAIECIVACVEHATARWAAAAAGTDSMLPPHLREGTPDPFEVLIGAEPVALVGDPDVMHWCRGEGRVPSVLASALMALETYLYRRIDAGEDISADLERLKQSRSLAVWGLVVEIAKYEPVLLRGPLTPLVTGAALLLADKLYALHDHPHLLMSGISDRAFAERIREWNTMPHRKQTLIDFVMRDVLTGEALTDELATARDRWRELDAERWKHLIAQADPANHRLTQLENGAVMDEYVAPPELEAEIAESNAEASETQFWLALPYKLRESIDQGVRPNDEDLEKFWASVQRRLEEPADTSLFADRVRSREDLECGVAAFLVIRAPDWLTARPERESWCRRALLAPFEAPPASHDFDFAGELSTERWDVFAADALPELWAADPADLELRSAIARLTVNPHYVTVSRTFLSAAAQTALAEDVRRLEHLSLYWTRFIAWRHELRHRQEYAQHGFGAGPSPDTMPDVETPTRAALEAFTRGELPAASPTLRDWIAATPEEMLGAAMGPQHRSLASLDLGYLVAARSHFRSGLADLSEEERRARIEFAADLAALIATGLVPDARGDVDGTPDEQERSALDLLATLTVEATTAEARAIWEPLLAAGGPAHHWIEAYLGDIWRAALAECQWPPTFPELIKQMLAFATDADSWQGGQGAVDLAIAVVGLDRWGRASMKAQHADLLTALQPEWSDWVRPRLRGSWFARQAVPFFGEPVAQPLRSEALAWLADRERSADRVDSDLDEAVAELLVKIAVSEPHLLRGADETAQHSRYLLSRLAGRGNPLAVQLSSQLG